jgi:hypothetical protein
MAVLEFVFFRGFEARLAPIVRAGGVAAIRRRAQVARSAYERTATPAAFAEWQLWSLAIDTCQRHGYDDDTPPEMLVSDLFADRDSG